MYASGADGDVMFALGDRRQIEVGPAALVQQMACEVIDMKALHHHHN